MLTATVRDLHRQYPGKYVTDVATHIKEHIWAHNPYITSLDPPSTKQINMKYGPQLNASKTNGRHFLTAFHEHLNRYLGLDLKLSELRPDIHFTDEERKTPPVEGDYWVIVTGGKADMTAKIWEHARWQRVVDMLRGKIDLVQAGGGPDRKRPRHIHQPLEGVTDLIGRTDFRQLMRLILHCRGVVCGITVAMHLAGALNKPCVVIAGGRENHTWEAYTKETWRNSTGMEPPEGLVEHRFLHTIGRLGCCSKVGCWKKGTGELPPEGTHDPNCHNLVSMNGDGKLPRCLDIIEPDHVAEAILSYSTQGSRRPVSVRLDALTATGSNGTADRKGPTMLEKTGKVTICVLLYGDYEALHRRVISSIRNNTPKEWYKLIVGCNEVCQNTLSWLPEVLQDIDHELMIEPTNIYKYPFMRKMFARADTRWIIWFDDDSHTNNPEWLQQLAKYVYHGQERGIHCWGKKYYIHIKPGQEEWVQAASWYRGLEMQRDSKAKLIRFMTGGFWAITTEAIRKIDWPDPRIRHNGGDVMLGEALRQSGFAMQQVRIEGVGISNHKRRGHSELHPGIKH